jgi:Flp pilus assembly protein CpaB
MDIEYRDPSRRWKYMVILGIFLAAIAGGAAFLLLNQAQQQAGQGELQRVSVVVAARQIPARKPLETDDLLVRQVPLDPSNAEGTYSNPTLLLGLVPSVAILKDQLIFGNLLASNQLGGQFSILEPGEAVTADSIAWRAVSLTVPDDRAAGGMISAGDTVDIFVTVAVTVPQDIADAGLYYTDRSTKITYQNVVVLAKATSYYVIKVHLDVAEEIGHWQAGGAGSFTLALRPLADTREVDVSTFGETTNMLIQQYGLPVPETYPASRGGFVAPTPAPTPAPDASLGASPTPDPSELP